MSETPEPVSVPEVSPTPVPFVERLSDALQYGIGVVVGAKRNPPRRLKSLLNGTLFGHPLHPAITDVPITAWLLTAIFDLTWLITRTQWAAYGAFVTVIVGLVGALFAAVTGLVERLFAKRFTVQERIGQQIADVLTAMIRPHGVAHLCTQMRGVHESSPLTRTTSWRGEYGSDPALRAEFLEMCGGHQ